MKYKICQKCRKKTLDEVEICINCTGIRNSANKAVLVQMLGMFFTIFFWIFRTWIYSGPLLGLSVKTEVILMIGVFPVIGILLIIYGAILGISNNVKYDKLKSGI